MLNKNIIRIQVTLIDTRVKLRKILYFIKGIKTKIKN